MRQNDEYEKKNMNNRTTKKTQTKTDKQEKQVIKKDT